MEWNIPSGLTILDRLEELLEMIDCCPDSPLVPLWQREVKELDAQLVYAG